MMLVLAAAALLQAAPVHAAADWRAMSTEELAARLLPRRIARRVVEHEFTSPTRVTFITRTYPMPDGFCERDIYQVSTASRSVVGQSADIRRGDCPAAGAAGFAHVNPNPKLHVAQAKAAVRWLEGAIDAARGAQPLTFDVDCVANVQPDACTGGARAALAKLAVENAQSVSGAFTCRTSVTSFALRQDSTAAGPLWNVRLARGEARPRLTLTWTPPPRS
ncbi:MAG TPA: hypothetical protein VIV07_06760 [Sphingomicrobium sp.]